MAFFEKYLIHTVTVFVRGAPDGYGTNTSWSKYTTAGKWDDVNELYTDSMGRQAVSQAIVYLNVDPNLGDYLYLGTTGASIPPATAHEVKHILKNTSLFDPSVSLRKVIL